MVTTTKSKFGFGTFSIKMMKYLEQPFQALIARISLVI